MYRLVISKIRSKISDFRIFIFKNILILSHFEVLLNTKNVLLSTEDVNECLYGIDDCSTSQICRNKERGFYCECAHGFTLGDDGKTCLDAQPGCSNTAFNCSQNCGVNMYGSEYCFCNPGYRKNQTDGTICEDIDECKWGTHRCSQNCRNTEGGFNCECEFGYTLDDDRSTCIEVRDICSLYPDLNCEYGCKQDSTNKSIGYCFCRSGYQLQTQDKRTCIDINECNNDTLNKCTFKDNCVNIEGSYNCSCPEGYSLQNDGRTCKECGGSSYGVDCKTPCDCGAGVDRCDNVRGCICLVGWAGPKCESDINECRTGNPCTGSNQECKNTPGSYKCSCAPGYSETSSGICEADDFQFIMGLGIIGISLLGVLVMAIMCVYLRRRKRRGGSPSSSDDNFEEKEQRSTNVVRDQGSHIPMAEQNKETERGVFGEMTERENRHQYESVYEDIPQREDIHQYESVYEEIPERGDRNPYQELSAKGRHESKRQTYQRLKGDSIDNKYIELVDTDEQDHKNRYRTYYNSKACIYVSADGYINPSIQN